MTAFALPAWPTSKPCPTPTEAPAAVAQRWIGRPYLSWSAIRAFRSCPLKFYFRYVLQLPEPRTPSSLRFGTAVHAAIEAILRARLECAGEPSLDRLLAVFDDAWNADDRAVDFGKGESVPTLRARAADMLVQLLAAGLPQVDQRILGIEEEWTTPLLDQAPPILARLDLLTESDDGLVVTDFKTSRGRWSAEQADDNAEQLLLYAQVVGHALGRHVAKLRFLVLTKTKSPAIEVHERRCEPRAAKRTLAVVAKVWQAIAAGQFYPAPSPMNCATCPYREPCRRWPE